MNNDSKNNSNNNNIPGGRKKNEAFQVWAKYILNIITIHIITIMIIMVVVGLVFQQQENVKIWISCKVVY